MLILILLGKYLDKKADYEFAEIWQKKIIPRTRYILFGLFINFIVAVWLVVTVLTYGANSFLLTILVLFFTVFIYGFYFVRNTFALFAKNNARFVVISSGMQEDTFDKSNVVN